MNLIQRSLLVCSAILASLSLLMAPVQAATVADLPHITQATSIRVHANLAIVPNQASDHSLINQGCTCSSCLKTADLLQGKLPVM